MQTLAPPAGSGQGSLQARGAARLVGLLALCVGIYGVVALGLSRPGGFWSPDSAVRYVQVMSLERGGAADGSVPYPGVTLDPTGRFFPFGPWFHFVRGGKYYLSYPPYFAWLELPFHRSFGVPGLTVVPLAAGVVTVAVVYGFLRPRAPTFALLGAGALAFATPLLLYSTVFWDHTVVVALAAGSAIAGVAALESGTPSRLVGSGLLAGAGLWFRNEMYPFALALLLAWAVVAPRKDKIRGTAAFLGGLAVPAIPLWATNLHLAGSLLGWKGEGVAQGRLGGIAQALAGHGTMAWIADKLGNAYFQLFSPNYYAFNAPSITWGLCLAALWVLTAVLLRAAVTRRSEGLMVVGTLLGVASGVAVAASRTDVSGLLPAMPFVVLVGLSPPRSPWERFLAVLACIFVAEIVVGGTHGGLQWGPRYLLPVVPVLVSLAVTATERIAVLLPQVRPALRLSVAGLVLAGALIQVSGVDQVAEAVAQNTKIVAAVRSAPAEIVVTPLQWLTLESAPLYFDKTLMLVETPADLQDLLVRLAERRVSRWTYVPLSGPFFTPRRIEDESARHAWTFRVVSDRTYQGIRFVTFGGPARDP